MNSLAFSGSNSSKSINQQFIHHVAGQLQHNVDIIDLRDYDIPMFSTDIEQNTGIPDGVKELFETIENYDSYIISIPEHNGNYPAFFKNILDWLSRVDRKFFSKKPVLLLNATPSPNATKPVLDLAEASFGFSGATITDKFVLSGFNNHLIDGRISIHDDELLTKFNTIINRFEKSIPVEEEVTA